MVDDLLVEKKLIKIWREVLNLPEIGVEENFFQIGGDSILSIQMLTLAAEEGIQLDIGAVFEYPTISQLARIAENYSDQVDIKINKEQIVLQEAPLLEQIKKIVIALNPLAVIENFLPLTPMQSSILFRSLYDP